MPDTAPAPQKTEITEPVEGPAADVVVALRAKRSTSLSEILQRAREEGR